MKTRVNFYFDEFRPKTYLINLHFTALLWGLALLAVLVGAVINTSREQSVEKRLERVEQAIEDKRKAVTMMTSARDALQQDPSLLAAIEQLQTEQVAKNDIVKELGNREQNKSSGYSELMLDLARVHQPGIWLTLIRLDEANVRIEGGASNSAAVPQWLNKLTASSYFSGTEFAEARMFRDQEEQLQFVLSSTYQSAPDLSGETND